MHIYEASLLNEEIDFPIRPIPKQPLQSWKHGFVEPIHFVANRSFDLKSVWEENK